MLFMSRDRRILPQWCVGGSLCWSGKNVHLSYFHTHWQCLTLGAQNKIPQAINRCHNLSGMLFISWDRWSCPSCRLQLRKVWGLWAAPRKSSVKIATLCRLGKPNVTAWFMLRLELEFGGASKYMPRSYQGASSRFQVFPRKLLHSYTGTFHPTPAVRTEKSPPGLCTGEIKNSVTRCAKGRLMN